MTNAVLFDTTSVSSMQNKGDCQQTIQLTIQLNYQFENSYALWAFHYLFS